MEAILHSHVIKNEPLALASCPTWIIMSV